MDAGSIDHTSAILRDLRSGYPRLRLRSCAREQGLGGALRHGLAAAEKELIIYAPGDARYDPRDFARLLEALTPDVDIVDGRRTHPRAGLAPRGPRSLLRRMFGLPAGAVEGECRLLRRSVLDRVRLAKNVVASNPLLPVSVSRPHSPPCVMRRRRWAHGSRRYRALRLPRPSHEPRLPTASIAVQPGGLALPGLAIGDAYAPPRANPSSAAAARPAPARSLIRGRQRGSHCPRARGARCGRSQCRHGVERPALDPSDQRAALPRGPG